jgi:hypothetical protein
MADRIEIYDEYGNVGRAIAVTRDENVAHRWTLDEAVVLTDAECDRTLIVIDGHEPERLGRRLEGGAGVPITELLFVPPTSVEAMDAARRGERPRATPHPG